jgi:hypothetical protein
MKHAEIDEKISGNFIKFIKHLGIAFRKSFA